MVMQTPAAVAEAVQAIGETMQALQADQELSLFLILHFLDPWIQFRLQHSELRGQ